MLVSIILFFALVHIPVNTNTKTNKVTNLVILASLYFRLTSPSSTVNRLISKKTYVWPEVKDSDIDVFYIRGSGPGGQAVQKANNCVQIRHNPTGIVVKV